MKYNPRTEEAYRLFHNGILALSRAEQQGIRVDMEYVEKKKQQLTGRIERLENRFKQTKFFLHWQHSMKRVNINSNAQLSYFLYTIKKLKPAYTTESGQGATDEDALQQLHIPELEDLLEIRKLKKVRDTYLDAFAREQVGGFIHPFFNLHLVKTHRSSSDSPNFQNIPKRDEEAMQICRRALKPRFGHQLVEVDFSNLEVRIGACVTGDTKIETLHNAVPIKSLIRRINKGEKIYTYGYDLNEKRIKIAQITAGGLTGRKAEIWKIVLDNDQEVKATADHQFLLRNEEYKALKDLRVGDSLMPFYKTRKQSGWGTVYETVYLNNGSKITAHNLVAKDIFNITVSGSTKIVHHVNGNGCDNTPFNLQVMTRKDHMKIHSVQGWKNKPKGSRIFWLKTEEGKEWARKASEKRHKKWRESGFIEEIKLRISEGIKKHGGRKGEKNQMFGKQHSEEAKEKNRKSHIGKGKGKAAWNRGLTKEIHPGVARISQKTQGRKSWNKGVKGLYITSEETKKKISEAGKGRIHSEQTKERESQAKLKYWQDVKKRPPEKECLICHRKFYTLTNTHLRDKHNLTFDEYRKTYNHKVKRIEFVGYEDVYNINVEGVHNFAVDAGIIIKNCYHKDDTMIRYIKDPEADMHTDMAKQIFMIPNFDKSNPYHYTLRQAAKNGFVFPEFYGDYYGNCAINMACTWGKLPQGKWSVGQGIELDTNNFTLADHLIAKGINSLTKFTEHVKRIEQDFWENRFSEYSSWKERWWRTYQRYGYVDLLSGFRCSGVMGRNEVINTPVQGAAFHCLLWSFIEIDRIMRERKWDTRLVGQIHDSMLLDTNPDELEEVKQVIRQVTCEDLPKAWSWIIVPLDVDLETSPVDGSWADKDK